VVVDVLCTRRVLLFGERLAGNGRESALITVSQTEVQESDYDIERLSGRRPARRRRRRDL
jgi:hypothetical protein